MWKSKILYPGKTVRLHNCLSWILDWCTENCMRLNVSKCSVALTSSSEDFMCCFSGFPLTRKSSVNDLGVGLTKWRSFSEYIVRIVNRAASILGYIIMSWRCRLALGLFVWLSSRSKLGYCSVMWSPQRLDLIYRIECPEQLFASDVETVHAGQTLRPCRCRVFIQDSQWIDWLHCSSCFDRASCSRP